MAKTIFSASNPNLHNILVKMFMTDNCIALRTYDRVHGGRGRFLIIRDRFAMWLKGMPEIEDDDAREALSVMFNGAFYDTDCGHMLIARRDGQNVHFEVMWLSSYGNGDVRGFTQHFDVPIVRLIALVDEHINIQLVQRENGGGARISCKNASGVIQRIQQDKRIFSAFRKAMRDCFRWRGDTVTLYADGRYDFYFSAEGRWSINGGLILHESTVQTRIGMLPKVYYGIHT